MTTTAAVPSGFEAQFQQFVYYAGPMLQIALWLVMIFAAIYALVLFKRLVDFQTGAGKPAKSDDAVSASTEASAETKKSKKDDAIKVEEFVE